MALQLAVACALLAFANAGQIMFGQQMQTGGQQMQMGGQQMQMVPAGNGCNQGTEGCAIPDMGVENMEEYLEQQMEQQQYETQAMADRIKAQFEGLVKNVSAKKTRFAMSIVTEFISMCECGRSSNAIYSSVFLESAKSLNLTDTMDMTDDRLPYQAKSEKEARELVFMGLIKAICEAAGTYLTFADQVNQRIPAYTQARKKPELNLSARLVRNGRQSCPQQCGMNLGRVDVYGDLELSDVGVVPLNRFR
ncbi:uncharacterized protein LOC143287192 [Babylonia areolata]|uniref:uncharacterized protein LOC143287192 n=1 Tax=Babylonia areolata TaxID=304850 RepID=UPI003FD2216A